MIFLIGTTLSCSKWAECNNIDPNTTNTVESNSSATGWLLYFKQAYGDYVKWIFCAYIFLYMLAVFATIFHILLFNYCALSFQELIVNLLNSVNPSEQPLCEFICTSRFYEFYHSSSRNLMEFSLWNWVPKLWLNQLRGLSFLNILVCIQSRLW